MIFVFFASTPHFTHAAFSDRSQDRLVAELGAGLHVFACLENEWESR